jgi:Na+-translocating ferredoxin:NAD+ oxidoreductase RnfD subunit
MPDTAEWKERTRLGGLRRFAVAISILNILGHVVFGFEQAWITPFVSLGAAYSTELLLEFVDARMSRRRAKFAGGPRRWIDFLLSAHITGLAVAMLLYANQRLWPVAFASIAAIASKSAIRVPTGSGERHVFNPSNFGISVALLCFPWVGIAPPYHFTENLDGAGDWLLPAAIVCTGTMLNARFTKRLPLVAAWLAGFVLQAVFRHWFLDAHLEAALLPMTGVAFILYTFYMVTDPATTPSGTGSQIVFGASVAATYGILVASHIVFGLFFALSIVCAVRGAVQWMDARTRRRAAAKPAEILIEPEVAAAVR